MSNSLSPQLLTIIAERFKVLAEPARLTILNALRDSPRTVTDLVETTGLGQANVSKHLQLLHAHGFVSRRKEGLFAYYSVADRDVYRLCDIMCGRLESQASARRKLIAAR
jgi:DNA-binding transcriptional ArsR family regulator